MKKTINVILKIVLSLLLIMPILGSFGIFPEPTADMYNTKIAFDFIEMLMVTKYVVIINSIVFAISLILLWTNRVALASLLILPITVNIIAFHWFLDGGPFTGGALMGNVLLAINIYFLWKERASYNSLLKKSE